MSNEIRVVLATLDKDLDEHLKVQFQHEETEESRIVVTSIIRDEEKLISAVELTDANVILWRSYLVWRDTPEETKKGIEKILRDTRKTGARSILISSDRESLLEWMEKGFWDFVYAPDENISIEEIIRVVKKGQSLKEARLVLNWTVDDSVRVRERLIQEGDGSSLIDNQEYEEVVNSQVEEEEVESKSKYITALDYVEQAARPIQAIRKFETEEEEEIDILSKAKIVAFWSVQPGMGVSTFAQAAAIETAKRGLMTALIEWDLFYPSVSYALGLSHPERNLEKWIEKSQNRMVSIEKFVLNKKIWQDDLSKMPRKSQGFAPVIKELPSNLFVLAPSEFSRSWTIPFPKPEMVRFVLEELVSRGFQAIYMDVPSELLFPVTGVSLRLAEDIFAFTTGRSTHVIRTFYTMEKLEEDLGKNMHLIFNRMPDGFAPVVQNTIKREPFMILPEDDTLLEKSYEMKVSGDEKYQKSVESFCDQLGFYGKAKTKTEDTVEQKKKSFSLPTFSRFKREPENKLREFLNYKE